MTKTKGGGYYDPKKWPQLQKKIVPKTYALFHREFLDEDELYVG